MSGFFSTSARSCTISSVIGGSLERFVLANQPQPEIANDRPQARSLAKALYESARADGLARSSYTIPWGTISQKSTCPGVMPLLQSAPSRETFAMERVGRLPRGCVGNFQSERRNVPFAASFSQTRQAVSCAALPVECSLDRPATCRHRRPIGSRLS